MKVLFAGEHLANWQGYMEDAVGTGEKAAQASIWKPGRTRAGHKKAQNQENICASLRLYALSQNPTKTRRQPPTKV
jgi:hypothetical protein